MNSLQHTTIMAIEELTVNHDDYISVDKIASTVMNRVKVDLGQIQETLNFLYRDGYLSGTKTGYKLIEKGYIYTWTYDLIDERVTQHVNSKYSSQISCLWIAVVLLAITVFVFGLIIFR
jgi:hypothetical protein